MGQLLLLEDCFVKLSSCNMGCHRLIVFSLLSKNLVLGFLTNWTLTLRKSILRVSFAQCECFTTIVFFRNFLHFKIEQNQGKNTVSTLLETSKNFICSRQLTKLGILFLTDHCDTYFQTVIYFIFQKFQLRLISNAEIAIINRRSAP